MTKRIELTQGQTTQIDDCDFERVNRYKWRALWNGRDWYAVRTVKVNRRNRTIYLHRFITNAPDGMLVDHINHSTLDNRRSNLRLATQAQNQHNSKKQCNNTSGYKGVFWHRAVSRWRAQIVCNGKTIHIGHYDTPEQAAIAYDNKARELFGIRALLNFQRKERGL